VSPRPSREIATGRELVEASTHTTTAGPGDTPSAAGEPFDPETTSAIIRAEYEHRHRRVAGAVGGREVLGVGRRVGYETHILAEAGAFRAVGLDVPPGAFGGDVLHPKDRRLERVSRPRHR